MGLGLVPHHTPLGGAIFIGQHKEVLVGRKVIFDLYYHSPEEFYVVYKIDGERAVVFWDASLHRTPHYADEPTGRALRLAYEAAVNLGYISGVSA